MWTVLRMVKGKALASEMEMHLVDAGIICKQKPVYKNVSETDNYFELLVLSSEAEAANECLMELGI